MVVEVIGRYNTELGVIWSRDGELRRLLMASRPAAFASGGPALGNCVGELVDRIQFEEDLFRSFEVDWRTHENAYDHDIAAFVETLRDRLPTAYDDGSGDPREDWHSGRTSSDLSDTALGIGMLESHIILTHEVRNLQRALAMLAWPYKDSPILGRTHGQPAEPTSIGRKFAVIALGLENVLPDPYDYGKVSGPVGTDTLEEGVALQPVGLRPVAGTQVVPRWHLASYFHDLATLTIPLSTLATEIRLGSTHGWLREGRLTREARGSSAMPQKRNPIRSERAVGLTELIRHDCYAVASAGATLWNERDISHSSVERVALPEALILTHFVLRDLAKVVDSLEVGAGRAAEGTDLPTGEGVMLDAVRYGHKRADVYRTIRAVGPETAAVQFGVSGVGRKYDPASEPELWTWIKGHTKEHK